ncbi:MAG TPA: 6-bladed beta-propeller [Solirubrobacterales bacterium]|nr:6-bladed beta-propeller [Solirubrobacterales bacterium]
MKSSRATLWRLVIATAISAMLIGVVPVLAESPEAPPSAEFEDPVAPPDAGDVAAGLAVAEQAEHDEEVWLASPEAETEREGSQTAYTDISASDALALLTSQFAEQLEILNADPARFLSDAKLDHTLSETAAAVTAEGDSQLLEASIPVRVEDEEGDLSKVDVNLEPTVDGFETANAVADVAIPQTADQGVEVGEDGLAITQAGANSSSNGRRLGDKNIFFPEVHTDTDLLVSPTATGVELFDQLRSADSPEELRFHLDLPDGAQLEAADGGGARVSAGGDETLAEVLPPTAVDAQGTEVPVSLSVDGSSIVLKVAHRDAEYAYPILVDPIVEDWVNNSWYSGLSVQGLGDAWALYQNNGEVRARTWCIHTCWGSGMGLYISTVPNVLYYPENYSHFVYSTPNTSSYIAHFWISPFFRNDNGCSSAQPHDYDGIWTGTTWEGGVQTNDAKTGTSSMDGYGGGHAVVIGLSTGPPGVWISCWRDIVAGGVAVWLDDEAPPLPYSMDFSKGPGTGWIGANSTFSFQSVYKDAGLGVRHVTIAPEGAAIIQDQVGNCTGLFGARCPTEWTDNWQLSAASFDEGEKKAKISAEDPTGKTSTTTEWTTRVDRTPPNVTLSGQFGQALAEAGAGEQQGEGGPELTLPVFNVKVEATDGSNATNAQKRSGVKSIEVLIDGTLKKTWTQTATEPSRPMTQTYPLTLIDLAAGIHKLKVVTKDQVEQPRTIEKEFEYTPATGMKDDYAMQRFPLPDGEDHSDEEVNHGPELAVNLMNGNVVFHERDVHVEGVGADLDLERFYNSQLPTAANTEWGDGWTLAQTPELDPQDTGGSPAPDEAELVDASGALDDGIKLPVEAGKEEFDAALQGTLTKEGSGYALTDESGRTESTIAFDANGQAQELRTEPGASVDYAYEGGELAEIAVEDPKGQLGAPPAPPSVPASTTTPSYVSVFGSSGTGNGQFNHPADVALAANGNLWVVDTANNRIEQFTASGQFVSKVGSAGFGNGQFNRPTAIAINSKGNILVTDATNKRVQVFNEKGEFVKAFGSAGTGNGQFGNAGPEGIAVDAKGFIWVCDTSGGRLEKFSEAGEFVKALGTKGSGNGQLGEPTGVDIATDGKIWITDWSNNRVAVFNEAGEFVKNVGGAGSGNGQFSHPDGIDIDSRGTVWVLDQSNGRIQGFNQAGEYVTQFGAKGSGAGQFSFSYPAGLVVSARGQFWIADTQNNRVQRWSIPNYVPSYALAAEGSFGTAGSGDGQFNLPADLAVDAKNNLWVVDSNNNRLEKFNEAGTYVSKFGSLGSANGKLIHPSAVAIDAAGNLWVADPGNRRVQKFTEAGAYVSKFGTAGTGNGQFGTAIEGLAISLDGKIWVSDTSNNRLQVFNEKGEFVKVVGAAGSGPGQLQAPRGLAVDRSGNVWVADSGNNRLEQFGSDGAYVGQLGSEGTGNGQFKAPSAVDVDRNGIVWVMDAANNRIQTFDEAGGFISSIGSSGSGSGQFSLSHPSGIASDPGGRTWITDSGNSRVQKWVTPAYAANEQALEEMQEPDDATADIDTSAGLVTSVDPEGAGESTYSYSGDDLVSHTGPAGQTKYEYDSGGRMTKVTLPNGTFATVKYDATYHRATSVTVDPAGAEAAQTTLITYKDEPRETEVQPPSAPVLVYHFGNDGELLTWSNVVKPPEFDDIAGSLWANRETASPISSGDQNLLIQAHSDEGISEIQILIQGNRIADEKQCQQTEAPGIECKDETLEWVTNTVEHEPGIVQLEAVIKDRLGAVSSQRFWVNIPVPPPVAPGTPKAPSFAEVVKFREEFGLDLDLNPVKDELALHDRVFDLIGAWYNPSTPEGAVARSATERWGVPLRPIDVAELEYREWYLQQDATLIPQWAAEHAASTYSGYYVSHREGGLVYVQFTANSAQAVSELKASGTIPASDRLRPAPAAASYSLKSLYEKAESLFASASAPGVTTIKLDESSNRIRIESLNVAATQSWVNSVLGAGAPVDVQAGVLWKGASDRFDRHGPLVAGQHIGKDFFIDGKKFHDSCSAGFGVREAGPAKPNSEPTAKDFLLTAGHCYKKGEQVGRYSQPEDAEAPTIFGTVERRSFDFEVNHFSNDAEAIRLKTGLEPPQTIFPNAGEDPIRINKAIVPYKGMPVCMSGARSNRVRHGVAIGTGMVNIPETYDKYGEPDDWYPLTYQVNLALIVEPGDSGGPAWQCGTGRAIGLMTGEGRRGESSTTTLLAPEEPKTPWYPYGYKLEMAPGILNAPGMGNIFLVTSR